MCAPGTPDEWLGVMPTDLDGGGGGRGVYVFARSLLNYLKKNGVCVSFDAEAKGFDLLFRKIWAQKVICEVIKEERGQR